MDSKKFSVYNKTRDDVLCPGIVIVDAVLEPLKVLKVLIEGLPVRAEDGLWLTHFKGIPVARTLSPFDLVYLDNEYRVVHSIEVSSDSDFAPFKALPESALVLPAGSLSGSGTRTGDYLVIRVTEPTVNLAANQAPRVPVPTSSTVITQATRSLRDLTPHTRFTSASFPAPPAPPPHAPNSPLDQFFSTHPSSNSAPGPANRSSQTTINAAPGKPVPVPASSMHQNLGAAPARDHASGEPRAAAPGAAAVNRVPQPAVEATPNRPAAFSAALISERVRAALAKEKAVSEPRAIVPSPTPVARFPQPPKARRRTTASALANTAIRDSKNAPDPFERPLNRPAAVAPARLAAMPQVPPNPPPAVSPAMPPRPAFPPASNAPKPAPFANPQYFTSELESQSEEPPTRTVRFLRWLFPELTIRTAPKPRDRRRASRLPLPGLVAYFFTGGAPTPHKIGDISVTGFYLQTEERWMPGTIIRMTLQRLGAKGQETGENITVHSRVVRWGADGGGFEFVLSGFLE
jgi:hypothetical protein